MRANIKSSTILRNNHCFVFTVTVFAYLILILTTSTHSIQESIERYGQTDSRAYVKIAQKINPNLVEDVIKVQKQRFFWPSFCGVISKLLGISLDQSFYGLVLVAQLIFLGLMLSIFKNSNIPLFVQNICLLITIFNPYTFRYYLAYPGMLPGMTFMTGVMLICSGLTRASLMVLITGLVVSTLSRQSILIAIPAMLLWVGCHNLWLQQTALKRIQAATVIIAVPTVVYVLTAYFTMNDYTGMNGVVWYTWYDCWLEGRVYLYDLIKIFVRVTQAYWTESLILISLLCCLRRDFFTKECVLLFVFFLSIGLQVMVLNPKVGDNVMRYFWHGYAPLIILLSHELTKFYKKPDFFSSRHIVVLGLILLIGSFHHNHSFLSNFSNTKLPAFALHKLAGLYVVMRLLHLKWQADIKSDK